MFCPKCGSEVQEGSSFCGKCGAPVGAAPTQKGAEGGAAGAAASSAPAPKKSGARIGIVVAAVVVVLLAVVGFATNGFGLGGVQPKEAVDVLAASQDSPAEGSGEGAEGAGEDAANGNAGGQSAAAEATVKSAVEAYTWDELSQISAEIAAAGDEAAGIEVAKKYNLCTPDGKLDGTQVKSVTLTDGTQTAVQIVGFNHDDKTAGGKAGITFLFGDALAKAPMVNGEDSSGGWENSSMRSYLSGDTLMRLPEDLRAAIVPVDKSTNNDGVPASPESSLSCVTTTSDLLWLPSQNELYGSDPYGDGVRWFDGYGHYSDDMSDEEINALLNDVLDAEGAEYQYFKESSVGEVEENGIYLSEGKEALIRNYEGEPISWWTRTPYLAWEVSWCCVNNYGGPSYSGVDNSEGVVPGFCI
ncbi:DUF6273 domain-containing protein [uncultured Adlercreutzia sp.]|uniref:DUF6273 domain-containing protein n=1 Tax=uncultured Adlercreutzia sp. TaxID=875803 RepID=UPI0025D5F5BE|nr:DUF6273 domain-containing protein [uncultured Adlercreutzia sp.]